MEGVTISIEQIKNGSGGAAFVSGSATTAGQPSFIDFLSANATVIGLGFTALTLLVYSVSVYYDIKFKRDKHRCDCDELEKELERLRVAKGGD